MTMASTLLWLHEISRADTALVGGKAANLGELIHAGLPVPPGFVLTTEAYRQYLRENTLDSELERLAGMLFSDDDNAQTAAQETIRSLFLGGTFSPNLLAGLAAAYEKLGQPPVAVRSSATAEDQPNASFAGQQDTYLSVEGLMELCDAVRRCWASLWNERAVTYRRRQEIEQDGIAIAVVVQQLVPALSAGVLFTANPLNGRRDQMVVNASWGLGESVVSGDVTPDQWVLDGGTRIVLESRLAAKNVMTVRVPGGTTVQSVPDDQRERPTLTTVELMTLASLGGQAAAYFGSPQDIEWARTADGFLLLQARPVTSLFPLPEGEHGEEQGLNVYVSFNLTFQGLVEPFTPAGIEVWHALFAGLASAATGRPPVGYLPWVKEAAGRIYVDMTALLRKRSWWSTVVEALSGEDPATGRSLAAWLDRDGDRLIRRRTGLRIPWCALGRALRTVPLPLIAPAVARRRAVNSADRELRALEREASRLTSTEDRLSFVRQRLGRALVRILDAELPGLFVGLAAEGLTRAMLRAWCGKDEALAPILRSLPANPTTAMGIALWQVSRSLKVRGAHPSVDDPEVSEFLQRYGHRAAREIDAGMPRWSEDPGPVLDVLRTYLSHTGDQDPARDFEAGMVEADHAIAGLLRRVGMLRSLLLRPLLKRIRLLSGLREQPKYDMVRVIAVGRHVLGAIGQALAASQRLANADDVFFLRIADIEEPDSDLTVLAAAGKAMYRRDLLRSSIPRVLISTGEALYGPPMEGDTGVLTGTPVSPGVYQGTVRVVLDPAQSGLQTGDVLVCSNSDPSWTPLFLTAGALVMAVGGTMSHGAVVAREYGIPAVVGIEGATTRLRTGDRVLVNGETGQVQVLSGDGT